MGFKLSFLLLAVIALTFGVFPVFGVSTFQVAFDPTAWPQVYDCVEYNNKIYFSVSPYRSIQDGGDIVEYDPALGSYQKVYSVQEQGSDLLYNFNGKIYAPGADATESWDFGNFYTFDGASWQKHRTIPNAVHVNEMAYLNGILYAIAQAKDATHDQEAILYSSTDDGATWTKDVNIGKPANVFLGGLTSYNGKIYVFGTDYAQKGYLFSGSGSNWTQKDTMPWATVMPRRYFMEFNGSLYIGTQQGLYEMDSLENVQKIGALGSKIVQDFTILNGELYAAVFDSPDMSAVQARIDIYSSQDGSSWALKYGQALDSPPPSTSASWVGVCLKGYQDTLYLGLPFLGKVYKDVLPSTLSVSLSASPSSGVAPLNGVDLTASISGTASGLVNYTFYCNRADTGTNIVPGWSAKYDGAPDNPKTATDACSYTAAGNYTVKVVAERGSALPVEARAIVTVSPPSAPGVFPGWDNINYLYYDPTQDNPANKYLEQAANELKSHLGKAGKALSVSVAPPAGLAVVLRVDPSLPEFSSRNEEAFKLYTDANGVYVIGKTALAVRHGAYSLLEKLGFRWFFKHPIWSIAPKTLISLSGLNEIQEPAYLLRNVGILDSIMPGSDVYVRSYNYMYDWQKRNKGYGATFLPVNHSYAQIVPRSEYAVHPEWFLPENRYPSYPWQLRVDNPEVVAKAIEYAKNELRKGSAATAVGILPIGAVSISPNDGTGWDPPWPLANTQFITDKVFYLTNEVAKAIKSEFPGKYVSTYLYSRYSEVPSFELEPNIIVQITTDYNMGSLSLVEQIEGMRAKGVQVGIRDYLGVWGWSQDSPALNLDKIRQLSWYPTRGIRIYNTEAYDGWGSGAGLTNYLASKLLWDPGLNVDDLLDDFYTKAFGPAKAPMKTYFEKRDTTKEALKISFQALSEAESLAGGGSEEILERIRYQEYHNRYVWLWKNVGIKNLELDKLKSFYGFVTKIRDLYVVLYRGVEPAIRAELKIRGLTDAEVNALQNFTLPTAAEARAWLNEGLAEFSSVLITLPEIPFINPKNLKLVSLNDASQPKFTPLYGSYRQIIIPSSGNEDVTVMVKGSAGLLQWYSPTGMLLDSWRFMSVDNLINWTPVKFRTDMAGTYTLHVTRAVPYASTNLYVDVPDRPASILADPNKTIFKAAELEWLPMNAPSYQRKNEMYFYVPSGTAKFIFGADVSTTNPDRHAFGKIIDSRGVEYLFDFGVTAEKRFDSPAEGLWKLEINTSDMYRHFWFQGITPLVWHDPKYLLVGADAPPPSLPPPPPLPVPDPISYSLSSVDRLYLFKDRASLLKILGNFDLNTNFSIQFLQNANLLSSLTYQPKDASTLEINLEPAQTSQLPIGFYDLKITRTTDSVSQTYQKQILVTQLGDLWSQAATEISEQKRDGKINGYDVSRLLSKWGSTNVSDLSEADINSGLGGVSSGRIDLYDANLLMKNWRP